ncbi:hypothetical protein [Mucilaginibacter flavidus]|uniref:hypothetical protein n=1 Tax=Mucilaginibacter flavidus TaxID=2949309 RepID=UPI0020931E51|nr:hypothetical protein [Mucilaginibacter flavidus]MCO5949838.1 hypothetical protein [Mucilaginibacter flavidus]
MESLVLNLQSKHQITDYIANNHLMPYEAGIFKEMLNAVETGDQTQLDWFRSFGDSFRSITMNIHAYRKGQEFGFTEISFDKNGWFTRPVFLDREELTFGDTSRYGNHSLIYLGRGKNHIWTYGMNYSYGVAGGCYGLSVYGKQFRCREDALAVALNELKLMMTKKIGSTDTTNDKQPVILATLRDIDKALIGMVQLSLF